MARKKIAEINKQLWDRANNQHRQRWQSISQKSYDFYLNEQLTKNELDSLNGSGMPTFTINRITPIIETMKYFVTANNPRWKAVGVTGDDTDIAQIHSDIADYCWSLSNGSSVYGQVILDSLVKGLGIFLIDVDEDMDDGKGEVIFKRVDPYDLYVDPASRDFLFRDAGFIQIKKNLTRSQLMLMLPQFKRKIKNAAGSGYVKTAYSQRDIDNSDNTQPEDIVVSINPDKAENDDILEYIETYKKVKQPYVNTFIQSDPTDEQIEQAQLAVDVQMQEIEAELQVQLKEKQQQIQQQFEAGEIIEDRARLEMQRAEQMTGEALQEQRQLLVSQMKEGLSQVRQVVYSDSDFTAMMKSKEFAKNVVDFVKFNKTKIQLECTVGSDVFLYEYVLPISDYPIVPIPYLYTGTVYPVSAVTPLVGKQQEINKAHQVMLHNANLASNLRWQYEEGSIPEEDWEQYSSSPGALLKYRQGFNPPTHILPAPINNAFYTVVQEGKADMEYIAGVPSAMMGFVQDQAETYRGLLANDEFGTRRLKSWMNTVVEPGLEFLGNVFKDISQKHYGIDKVFRIVQPNAGGELDEKEQRINIPIYNDYGEVIGKWKDYESANLDIRIVSGTTLPVNRWALLEEYFKWFQAGLIDDIHMIAETDIRNKKQLIERKSLYSQLQGQLEQLSESLKDKEGTIETLERQLVQAGIKLKVKDAEGEIRKEVLQSQAEQKLLRGTMKGEYDNTKKDLERELKLHVDNMKQKEKNNLH